MIEAFEAQADDALAWYAVVADPGRRVDQAIDARLPFAGRVVLEVGPHAAAHAIRHAASARQVYAANAPEVLAPRGALPSNASLVRLSDEGFPLRDRTVDLAILRAGLDGKWPLGLEALLKEVERVTGAWGRIVGVHLAVGKGELGTLVEGALGNLACEREAASTVKFAERGFVEESVETVWQAPGRSILRRVLWTELAGAPHRDKVQEVASANLTCAYRLHLRRQLPS